MKKEAKYNAGAQLGRLMGKIALIFGVPACVALVGGIGLDHFFGTRRRYVLIALIFAFVLSWTMLWRFYRGLKARSVEMGPRGNVTTSVSDISGAARIVYDQPDVWQSKRKEK